jgi:ribonucleoside-diphosphate reductase beta chain
VPDEPLLQESTNQYVIFPINHDDMWYLYKELVGNFWSTTENIQQLDSLALNYNEKQYMKIFASIFASPNSHGLVNENFAEELCKIIQVTEAKFFYGHQLFVQNIHFEMYNKLLENFATNNEERSKLFKVVENYDSVSNKRAWINQWKHAPFGEQLMASACMHGLMFSSLEMTRDWLKIRTRNLFNHELVEILDKMIFDQVHIFLKKVSYQN